jgi:hypothetical protein
MSRLLNSVIAKPRQLAARSVAQFGYGTGMYLRRLVSDPRPIILTYHGVIEATGDPVLDRFCISARTLRSQLEQLGKVVDFVDVDGLLAPTRRGRPAVLLSFDDGFRSVHQIARPILRALGIPAIVSVAAGLVDTDRTIWSLEIDVLLLAGDWDAIDVPVNGARHRFHLRNPVERERARRFARETAWAGGGDVPLQLVDDLIAQ